MSERRRRERSEVYTWVDRGAAARDAWAAMVTNVHGRNRDADPIKSQSRCFRGGPTNQLSDLEGRYSRTFEAWRSLSILG